MQGLSKRIWALPGLQELHLTTLARNIPRAVGWFHFEETKRQRQGVGWGLREGIDSTDVCGKGEWHAQKAKSWEISKMELPNLQVCLGTDLWPLIVTLTSHTDGRCLSGLLVHQLSTVFPPPCSLSADDSPMADTLPFLGHLAVMSPLVEGCNLLWCLLYSREQNQAYMNSKLLWFNCKVNLKFTNLYALTIIYFSLLSTHFATRDIIWSVPFYGFEK